MEDKFYLAGSVGPFIDDQPLITHARIKPYIVAILLHRGAVRFNEVLGALTPHCAQVDIKMGMWDGAPYQIDDRSRLEYLIEEVLGEMVSQRILRYNEERDFWVLSVGDNRQNLPKIINWVAAVGGQIPDHLLLEMSRDEIVRLNRSNA